MKLDAKAVEENPSSAEDLSFRVVNESRGKFSDRLSVGAVVCLNYQPHGSVTEVASENVGAKITAAYIEFQWITQTPCPVVYANWFTASNPSIFCIRLPSPSLVRFFDAVKWRAKIHLKKISQPTIQLNSESRKELEACSRIE